MLQKYTHMPKVCQFSSKTAAKIFVYILNTKEALTLFFLYFDVIFCDEFLDSINFPKSFSEDYRKQEVSFWKVVPSTQQFLFQVIDGSDVENLMFYMVF